MSSIPCSPPLRSFSCFALATALCSLAGAQCATQWRTDGPFSTVSPQVWSVGQWDADGAGPLTAQVVAGRWAAGSGSIVQWHEPSASWTSLGTTDGRVLCMLATANGELWIGGDFNQVGGVAAHRLARFDGTTWSEVGGGVWFSGLQAYVYALHQLPAGDIVVGGFFSTAGAVAAASIARWNGANWLPFGAGANGGVSALAQLANGDLIAGGSFSQIGGVAAAKVARWDGSSWSAFGSGLSSSVRDLAVLADGTVVAANGDTYVRSGASWSIVTGNPDYQTSVVALPNGELITGGIAGALKRWNGSTWTAVGPATSGAVNHLLVLANGDIAAAGHFSANGTALPSLMALTTSCEAAVADLGAGCAGTIAAANLPWTGSVIETNGSGLPASSILVVVHGFTPVSIGLDTVFATGVTGCTLQASPDVLELLLPIGGAASSTLALPDNPAIAGIELWQQWVTFELTPTFDFGPVTATNTLRLTVGSF